MDKNRLEGRLLLMAGGFLILNALILTLAPAGRARNWQVDYIWVHWAGILVWIVMFTSAHHELNSRLPERDPFLLPVTGMLSGWGLLTIWRLYPYFGWRQSLWLVIAVGLLLTALRFPQDLRYLRRYKYIWLSGGLLLTALTLFLGTSPLGTGPRLWLGCCGLFLQPSEPLKFLLIVYLAAYLAGLGVLDRREANLLPLLAPTLVMTGLALLLLIGQRDLGTASVFIFLYAVLVYLATGRWQIILGGGLVAVMAAAVGYGLFDVVRLRMDAWLNPWVDPSGRSYQIVQSLIAIANGGLFGRGMGLGAPRLVPIPHSDFIYTALVEEHGLTGALGLLVLVALLAQRGIRAALGASGPFRRYLAAGLTAHLVAQSILIIGGNIRLLPLTGVTLPFVSYGGSSLVTSFASLAILLHISSREEDLVPAPLHKARPYQLLTLLLLVGLGSAGVVTGRWSVLRGPDLLLRTDNPRRALTDLNVPRGSLLDRNGQTLVQTIGERGSYSRQVDYPPLSGVLGYNHAVYGQSGLEASLDEYLRGQRGYPDLTLWWHHLLYGTPPPGLDVRLTLNLDLQIQVDQMLATHTGAAILLNADSGEILALASYPGFDANTLEQEWENLVTDPRAPLLNRVTQGRYPAGSLIDDLLSGGSSTAEFSYSPQIRLPVAPGSSLQAPENPASQTQPASLSPLQAAGLASVLSSGGVYPAMQIVQAVNTPLADWMLLPALDAATEIINPDFAAQRANDLRLESSPFWGYSLAHAGDPAAVSWFLGGTLPDWKGAPQAVVVVLENRSPEEAERIGIAMLNAAAGR